jgi:hypothetical protein
MTEQIELVQEHFSPSFVRRGYHLGAMAAQGNLKHPEVDDPEHHDNALGVISGECCRNFPTLQLCADYSGACPSYDGEGKTNRPHTTIQVL